jgi:nitrogen fixation protein FixH
MITLGNNGRPSGPRPAALPLTIRPLSPEPAPPRPRAWLWPAIILGLLGGQVALSAIMIYVASSDPSFAVEPDYYQRAVGWDQRSRGAELTASVAIAGAADLRGEREARFTIHEADGRPLRGALVTVVAFHHGRAADRRHATLTERDDGVYLGWLLLGRPGLWEFRLTIERDGRTRHCTLVEDVAAASGRR